MKQLITLKDQLISTVQGQMGNLSQVDTKELGEVIDMIKDLSEAIYYCEVYEAMERAHTQEQNGETNNTYYYTERYLPSSSYPYQTYPYYLGMEKSKMMGYEEGNRYYNENNDYSSNGGNDSHSYSENRGGSRGRDGDGNGALETARRNYQESADLSHKIKELENYAKELTSEVVDMIKDATPEEKTLLQKRLNTLATKIHDV